MLNVLYGWPSPFVLKYEFNLIRHEIKKIEQSRFNRDKLYHS